MTERLVVKVRPSGTPSFCTLKEQLFATPLSFVVEGAGVNGSKTLLDSDVMTTGVVDSSGHYRVSADQPAQGNFQRALLP
jgi:hypothetical protein